MDVLQFIMYWLLECSIVFIFDIPVILVAWFCSKWYYQRKRDKNEKSK